MTVNVITVILGLVMMMVLMRLVVLIVGVAPRWSLIWRMGLKVVCVLRLEMLERLWRLSYVGVAEDLGSR